MPIDPALPRHSPFQWWLAIGVVSMALAVLAVAHARLRYKGLDQAQKDIVASVRRQLVTSTPGTVRISTPEELTSRRDDIETAIREPGSVEEIAGARDATRELSDAIVEAYRPLVEEVPVVARRLIGLAVLVTVLGTLAVHDESVVYVLTSTGGLANPLRWPQIAIRDTGVIVSRTLALPVLGTVWNLATAFGILFVDWLYHHVYVVAVSLVLIAAARTKLVSHTTGSSGQTGSLSARSAGKQALLVATGAYAAFMLLLGVAHAATSRAGALEAGVGIALAILVASLAYTAYKTLGWMYQLARDMRHAEDAATALATALDGVGVAAAALTAPLIPLWGLVSLLNLPTVIGAWLSATASVKLLTLLLVGISVAAVLSVARETVDDAREAFADAIARKSVRVALGARLLPVGGIVLVTLFAIGFGATIPTALVIGIFAGILSRGVYEALRRAKYRASALIPESQTGANRVVVHGYELTLPDGSTVAFARVNGYALAHTDTEAAIDAIIEAGHACFDENEPEPMVEREFAEDLRRNGWVDVEDTKKRLRETVRRMAEGQVQKRNGVKYSELGKKLKRRYPADIVDEERRWVAHNAQSPVKRRGDLLVPA